MRKKGFYYIQFAAIFLGIILLGAGCFSKETQKESINKAKSIIEIKKEAEKDLAIAKAKEIFRQKVAEGVDLSSGPCIAENLIPGWVADIAHNPRQPIDDLPENQCQNFREGKASHFVELDLEGNVIRVY